jgi:urea carboxylase-associated protein 1
MADVNVLAGIPQELILLDEIIPARMPWSGVIPKGRTMRIVDLEGCQAVDFLCYNKDDPEERYHAPNTIKAAGTLLLTKGHRLYSDRANALLTLVEDTFGSHDTIGGCCSAPSNKLLYDVDDCPGCRENFLSALKPWGLGWRDVVPNINFFMSVPVDSSGGAAIAVGTSKPNDFVDLRAEMDVLAAISNCPQINNPCNNFNPTPIRLIIW